MKESESTWRDESREQLGKFVYHMVPPEVVGDVLMPLSMLKEKSPDVYEREAKKYEGREHVQEIEVPGLQAKWNDVIHTTPMHPSEMKQAYVEAGGDPEHFPHDWYQIPIALITPDATVLFKDGFSKYDPKTLADEAHVPEETKKYYRETFAAGELPLLAQHAPHVLYKGTIPLEQCSKITV